MGLMANYHYNIFKKHFKGCRLFYTDTDSFQYEFHTARFEEELLEKGLSHLFDFSNIDKSLIQEGNVYHRLGEQEKQDILDGKKEKKQNGLMKDENDWREISEIICLSS